MKSGRRRLKPAQDPSPRWIVRGGKFVKQEVLIPRGVTRFSGRGAGAATKSLKNYEMYGLVLFMPKTEVHG